LSGVGLVALIDWSTGTEISTSIFYLAPIGLAVWFARAAGGVCVSLIAASVWLLLDVHGGNVYSHQVIPYWNALVRLGFFLLATYLLDRVRALTTNLKALVEERTAALAAEVEQHKQAEKVARESEAHFRQLAENIKEVFWITDPAKHKITYVSPGYEEIWGRTCQSLYDSPRDWLEAIHPEDRERVSTAALTKQAQGQYREVYRILRPDGSVRWIEDRAFTVHNEAGAVCRIVGVADDITALKRAADRNAALSRLAQQLSATTTSSRAADVIMATAWDLFGWDACYLHLYSPERDEIVPVLTMDTIGGQRVNVPHASFTLDPSPLMREVMQQGPRLINRDAPVSAAETPVPLVPFGDSSRPSASMMYAPLRHGPKVVGLLSIQSYTPRAYQRDDLETLAALADYVGGALERISAMATTRRLEEEILEISKREQRRIGFELHDGLCPYLGGIAFKAKELEETLQAEGLPYAPEAHTLVELINDAVAETHRLARGFAPIELEAYGLVSALEKLSREIEGAFGRKSTFTCSNPELSFELATALHLYRLAQEAIYNAIHHSQAGRIDVDLSCVGSELCLTIRDDGKGFVVNVAGRTGMGLRIMEYRSRALGGELEVSSRPNGGTEVRCLVKGWRHNL
jgi:PAS domain S-box-containing protein